MPGATFTHRAAAVSSVSTNGHGGVHSRRRGRCGRAPPAGGVGERHVEARGASRVASATRYRAAEVERREVGPRDRHAERVEVDPGSLDPGGPKAIRSPPMPQPRSIPCRRRRRPREPRAATPGTRRPRPGGLLEPVAGEEHPRGALAELGPRRRRRSTWVSAAATTVRFGRRSASGAEPASALARRRTRPRQPRRGAPGRLAEQPRRLEVHAAIVDRGRRSPVESRRWHSG